MSPEIIEGSEDGDKLFGGGGVDKFNGNGGNDTLAGGAAAMC